MRNIRTIVLQEQESQTTVTPPQRHFPLIRPYSVLFYLCGSIVGALLPVWDGDSRSYLFLLTRAYLETLCRAEAFSQLLAHQLQLQLLTLFFLVFFGYCVFGVPILWFVSFGKAALQSAAYSCILLDLFGIPFSTFFYCCVLFDFGCTADLFAVLCWAERSSIFLFRQHILHKQKQAGVRRYRERLLAALFFVMLWCLFASWITHQFYW